MPNVRLSYVKHNISLLKSLKREEKLIVLQHGSLKKCRTLKEQCLSYLSKNKVLECIQYTFQAFCHEVKNSLDPCHLVLIYTKTLMHAHAVLEALKKHSIYYELVDDLNEIIQNYHKASLFQERVIRAISLGVSRQNTTVLVDDAKNALTLGKFPKKPHMGASGVYIMQGVKRTISGIFKPFDEEIAGPNNPLKISFRGVLGTRTKYYSTVVGMGVHREVAASLVNEILALQIVPKTCYAEFTHSCFFKSIEGSYLKKVKTKLGSFQEYQAGFRHILEMSRRGLEGIPIDQLHRLMILDAIIGNMDRNPSNLLSNGKALIAIDHALSFSSEHITQKHNPLADLPQLQVSFFPSLRDKVLSIDMEKLAKRLKKHCFFDEREILRMKERIALLQEGVKAGASPATILKLMTAEHLNKLKDHTQRLHSLAAELYHTPT